jgi:hypothetical protein
VVNAGTSEPADIPVHEPQPGSLAASTPDVGLAPQDDSEELEELELDELDLDEDDVDLDDVDEDDWVELDFVDDDFEEVDEDEDDLELFVDVLVLVGSLEGLGVGCPSGPISSAGSPGGGGMIPGGPDIVSGITTTGFPSLPNQIGRIVCLWSEPVVVVTENELGGPVGLVSVVVWNVPDSTAVCAGTVIDESIVIGAVTKLVLPVELDEDDELFDLDEFDFEVVEVVGELLVEEVLDFELDDELLVEEVLDLELNEELFVEEVLDFELDDELSVVDELDWEDFELEYELFEVELVDFEVVDDLPPGMVLGRSVG